MIFHILKGNQFVNTFFGVALLLFPFFFWVGVEGNIMEYFLYAIPRGQFLYVCSKLAGLYGIVFLWLDVSYALLRETIVISYLNPWSARQHRVMALLSISLIFLHLVLFIIAVSMREQRLSLGMLLPNFSHQSYQNLLSLGATAFWLIIVVGVSGYCLYCARNNKRTFGYLHRLSFVCFLLVYFHGLGVGSETRNGLFYGFYIFMGASFLLFTLLRVFKPVLNRLILSESTISERNDDLRQRSS